MQEIAHIHMAAQLLQKYENKEWQQIIPGGDFPALLKLQSNIPYVRNILENTVCNTSKKEKYTEASSLSEDSDFNKFQDVVNETINKTPSHEIIETYTEKKDEDYRFEIEPHPIKELQDKTKDNTKIGRK